MVGAKYLILARQLATDIKNGESFKKDKLMPIRQFAQYHQVSVNTAIACYRELETQGLVEAKDKRGYFVRYVKEKTLVPVPRFNAKQSATLPYTFTYDYEHPFARAQSVLSVSSTQNLKSSMSNSIRKRFAQMQGYGNNQGLEELRTALCTHYGKYHFNLSADNLVVNNGCLDAIRIAILVTTSPGDVILVASPCFNGFLSLIIQLGRKILEVPSNQEGIDITLIDNMLSQQKVKACLFSANHHNPQGRSLSTEQKQTLAQLSNKHDIPIIEDDVYQELSFDGTVNLPIKAFDKLGTVIWCSSFSKTLASGFRVGWASVGKYKASYIKQRAIESFGVNLPIQHMIADFIMSGHYKRHLSHVRRMLSINVNQYRQILYSAIRNDGLIVSKPEGGMVLWCYVPNLNSERLQKLASEHNIGIRIGSEFSLTNLYREYFRINIGYTLNDKLEQQLLTLCRLISQCTESSMAP